MHGSWRTFARFVPIWSSRLAASARKSTGNRKSPSCCAEAVPTTTGTTAAHSVAGRAASSHVETNPGRTESVRTAIGYGSRGNFEKSGVRFSTKALRPSFASSVR